MAAVRITRRDRTLLELLAKKLRCASRNQLVASRTTRGSLTTPRRLQQLVGAGFLARAIVVASIPILSGPIATWRPNEPTPCLANVATALRRRDREAQPVRTPIYWATEQALEVVDGCGGKPRQPLQVQHDLGVAEVYLTRMLLDAATKRHWVSEDVFRELNAGVKTKVPDAVLLSPNGQLLLAVEFGGAYSLARLTKFHRFSESRNLPYEIW